MNMDLRWQWTTKLRTWSSLLRSRPWRSDPKPCWARRNVTGHCLARCAQLLFGRPEGELSSSPELKNLLRTGLPREYRARVWRFMIQTRTKSLTERHPDRYQELCEKSRTSPHLVPRQIQLDLNRTLTSNQYFSPPSSSLIQKLERVLQAFSWQNPTIGYVQGLNR